MVFVGKKDAKSEDDLGGFGNPPIPGRYHVVVQEVDESCEKYDSVVVDFEVLAGNKPDQEGCTIREFFAISEKARDRLSRLAMCLGLLGPSEEKDVNFTDGVGRHCVVEIEAGTYVDREGKTKDKVSISYAGIWSMANKKVRDVPKNAKALEAAGYRPAGPPPPQAEPPSDDDWGSLV